MKLKFLIQKIGTTKTNSQVPIVYFIGLERIKDPIGRTIILRKSKQAAYAADYADLAKLKRLS